MLERGETRKRDCRSQGAQYEKKNVCRYLTQRGRLYVAQCPEVGTVSQGQTLEEVLANLKEATELYLEEVPLPQTSRSLVTTFEVDNVA